MILGFAVVRIFKAFPVFLENGIVTKYARKELDFFFFSTQTTLNPF